MVPSDQKAQWTDMSRGKKHSGHGNYVNLGARTPRVDTSEYKKPLYTLVAGSYLKVGNFRQLDPMFPFLFEKIH